MGDLPRTSAGSTVSQNSRNYHMLGAKFPKQEVVFFCQVLLIYGVVITSLVNISLGSTHELWIALLTSCLGYLLPSPTLKHKETAPYYQLPSVNN